MNFYSLIKNTLYGILLFLSPGIVRAQSNSSVLNHYVNIAIKNNLDLKNRRLDVHIAQSNIKKARADFYPSVQFQASYALAHGGRTIDIPAGNLINPTNTAVNNLLGKNQLPTTIQNVSEPILDNNYQETKLHITQSLFNTDAYYNYKAKTSLLSAAKTRRQSFINDLTMKVKVAYFSYLKAREMLRIQDSTRVLLKKSMKFNEDLVKYHKATRDVVSSAKFELNKLQSKRAQVIEQRNKARSQFNYLLNRSLKNPIKVDSSYHTVALPPVNDLSRQALSKRRILQSLQYNIDANRQLVKAQNKHLLPDLFVSGDVGYQGTGYKFNQEQDFWSVRFGLKWSIFNGFKTKAKRQEAKIRVHRLNNRYENLKKQIRMQVAIAYDSYKAATINLRARQAAVKNAAVRFHIIQHKYKHDRALPVQYVDAQTKFTHAKISLTIAKYEVRSRKAKLDRASARY